MGSIDGYVFTTHCADMCIQTHIFLILFEQVWVVNPEYQSDEWVVNLLNCTQNMAN